MRRPIARARLAVLALAASLATGLASGCETKRGDRPPPAAKPISPPAVEPLPAPRGQPRMPAPTAPARRPERSPATTTSPDLDAGPPADAG